MQLGRWKPLESRRNGATGYERMTFVQTAGTLVAHSYRYPIAVRMP